MTATSMTFGRGQRIGMAVAVGIVALAVALAEHRREFLGEPACCFTASGLGQVKLATGTLLYIAASHEVLEGSSDIVLRAREKAHDGIERRGALEAFALDPVQELEQLVASSDRVAIPVHQARPSIS